MAYEEYFDFDEENQTITDYNPEHPKHPGSEENPIEIPSEINGIEVLKIGDYAFIDGGFGDPPYDVKWVTIPDTVTDIGVRAFNENSLVEVVIPDSVVSIGMRAFYGNDIVDLHIGSEVEFIDWGAFGNNKIENLVIPNSVEDLGTSAFRDNKISKVDISDNLSEIPSRTFERNELEEVTVPEIVTYIGENAFAYNSDLKKIRIPGDVELDGGGHTGIPGPTGAFNDAYNDTDQEAGTYVFIDSDNGWVRAGDYHSGTITGAVTDYDTGDVIDDAIVRTVDEVYGEVQIVEVDSEGKYTYEYFPLGTHDLQVISPGYDRMTKTSPEIVENDQEVQLDFELEAIPRPDYLKIMVSGGGGGVKSGHSSLFGHRGGGTTGKTITFGQNGGEQTLELPGDEEDLSEVYWYVDGSMYGKGSEVLLFESEESRTVRLLLPSWDIVDGELDWRGKGIEGTMSRTWTNLVNLTKLDLSNNSLSKNIPLEISKLVNLEELRLRANDFEGEAPELSDLIHLKVINFDFNDLTYVPLENYSQLSNLEELRLRSNDFYRSLPAEISDLSELRILDLQYNSFYGSIGIGISQLYKLEELLLNRNNFDDYEEGALATQANLSKVHLDVNNIDSTSTIDVILKDLYDSLDLEDRVSCDVNLTCNAAPSSDTVGYVNYTDSVEYFFSDHDAEWEEDEHAGKRVYAHLDEGGYGIMMEIESNTESSIYVTEGWDIGDDKFSFYIIYTEGQGMWYFEQVNQAGWTITTDLGL